MIDRMLPLITVIVPVYNTQKYLAVCINSIINQTYKNLQILLVDDGSTDSSPAICDDYAERDNRVSVINKENQGVSSARNLGIEMARGDYISFIDSDDWLEVDAYEHLVECILEHKVDAVIFEYFVDYESGKSIHKTYNTLSGVMNKVEAIESTISPVNRFAWSKIYASKLISNVRFEHSIHIGEDTLFACVALGNANSVYYSSTPIYHHVQSEVSATRCAFNIKKLTGIEAYYQLLLLCQKNYPAIIDVALSAYASRIISTIIDLCGSRDYPESQGMISSLNSKLRNQLINVLRTKDITAKVKLHVILCCISPWLPYVLHKRHGKLA